jgi:hypothetical protein
MRASTPLDDAGAAGQVAGGLIDLTEGGAANPIDPTSGRDQVAAPAGLTNLGGAPRRKRRRNGQSPYAVEPSVLLILLQAPSVQPTRRHTMGVALRTCGPRLITRQTA